MSTRSWLVKNQVLWRFQFRYTNQGQSELQATDPTRSRWSRSRRRQSRQKVVPQQRRRCRVAAGLITSGRILLTIGRRRLAYLPPALVAPSLVAVLLSERGSAQLSEASLIAPALTDGMPMTVTNRAAIVTSETLKGVRCLSGRTDLISAPTSTILPLNFSSMCAFDWVVGADIGSSWAAMLRKTWLVSSFWGLNLRCPPAWWQYAPPCQIVHIED